MTREVPRSRTTLRAEMTGNQRNPPPTKLPQHVHVGHRVASPLAARAMDPAVTEPRSDRTFDPVRTADAAGGQGRRPDLGTPSPVDRPCRPLARHGHRQAQEYSAKDLSPVLHTATAPPRRLHFWCCHSRFVILWRPWNLTHGQFLCS